MSVLPPSLVASEFRTLVLAPSGNDGQLTAEFLRQAGLEAEIVGNAKELCQKIAQGCGAVLIAEEALTSGSMLLLLENLKQQPAWSDVPLALITSGGAASAERLRRLSAFGAACNVTLLERPFRPGTLVSTVEVALRARRRQYQVRKLLGELGSARDAAERASHAKDEFLAALSHELRTPLNPVLLVATESAVDPALPPTVRSNFEQIARNITLEARLIDDLLDLTRITRGKLTLERQPLDVHAVLQDALAITRAEVEEKELTVETDFRATRSHVLGDSVRLQQVFWNVLKNAAKFTPSPGSIHIATRDDIGSGELVVSITDSGIGMTPEELERIFDAFAQGDHASGRGSHRFGGLGLGLAITRMLVTLHDGKISASSRGFSAGSTFVIQLPAISFTQSPGFKPGNTDLHVEPTSSRAPLGRRILLVEDHEATRQSLGVLLSRRGYIVTTAGSLAEARACADRETFDLVLSDIGLPDGNGCDLMTEMRRRNPVKGIALSGYGMDVDIALSREAGFEVHLTKPVRVQALDAALQRIESGAI